MQCEHGYWKNYIMTENTLLQLCYFQGKNASENSWSSYRSWRGGWLQRKNKHKGSVTWFITTVCAWTGIRLRWYEISWARLFFLSTECAAIQMCSMFASDRPPGTKWSVILSKDACVRKQISLPHQSFAARISPLWSLGCSLWMWVWLEVWRAWPPRCGSSILESLGRSLAGWAPPHPRQRLGRGRWCCPSSRVVSVLVPAPLSPPPPTEGQERCCLELEEPDWFVGTEERICGWEKLSLLICCISFI